MTNKQKIACNSIIHTASAAAAVVASGTLPPQPPLVNSSTIQLIQAAMVAVLATIFGKNLGENGAVIKSSTPPNLGSGGAAAQIALDGAASFGIVTNAITAAAITETMGRIVANNFAKRTA